MKARRTNSRRRPARALVAACVALSAVLAGCGRHGADDEGRVAPHFEPGFNLFSPEQDVEVGRQSAAEVVKQAPLLDDASPATAYVRGLGARLVARAPGEKYPYEFHVVDAKDVNAFALPGGFVFVNRGTIEAAKSEGELAGVMAHEISHVALRHGTSQASKAYVAQQGLGILQRVLGGGRPGSIHAGDVLAGLGGLGLNTLFLKFGRTAESQADVTGAEVMAEAGYDPIEMQRFFETLASSDRSRPPTFLSDHPDPGDRARAIERVRDSIRIASDQPHDDAGFARAKSALAALPPPRSERAQMVGPPNGPDGGGGGGARPEGPAAKDAAFRAPTGTYELSYPENWDALSDRGDDAVFAPRGGYGKLDDTFMITHGVMTGVTDSSGGDLATATRAFVDAQLAANPDFRVAGAQQATEIAGRPALGTPLGGPSPVTNRDEIDVVYTTSLADGRMFYVITVAPRDEADAYQAAFARVLGGIRFE